jgi:hypothetical protein
MHSLRLCGLLLLATANAAPAAGQYDFCVVRVLPEASETLRVRLGYSDGDPGQEGAALLLARHMRQGPNERIRVYEFDARTCEAESARDLMLVASPAEIATLWSDAGRTSLPEAASQATSIASGIYMGVARQAGKAITSATETANRMVCSLVRC